ncbi:MAG: hypothetical protein HOI15_07085 [Opitutales bacterium]|nr:hypothetical protein [Opitutales bacterium]
MRGSLYHFDSSAGSVFHRASKREFLLFLFAGILFLLGCYRMGKAGLPEDFENVSDFLIGAGIASLGFFISWFNGRRWAGLMLAIAVVARLLLLPMPVSEDLTRRIWEGEVLNLNYNPYEVAPDFGELKPLRDRDWERIRRKSETSEQSPLSLAVFRLCSAMGFNEWGLKAIFVVFDFWICIMLVMRYGTRKAVLYAWNPLVVYCVAGGGHMESLVLLPALSGFLIWDAWVDRKGGAVVINNNGGLGGGLGQMVSFAALLIGIAAAMNLVFLPIIIWMAWQVLIKSGLKSGMAILLVGLIPLLAFSGWAFLSLKVELVTILTYPIETKEASFSLIPGALNALGIEVESTYIFGSGLVVSVLLMFRNESLERYANLYIGTLILLGIAVYPWHFIWMAPFAIGVMHLGFRLIAISGFVYFLGFGAADSAWNLAPWQNAILWIPFSLGLTVYALTQRSKSDGFYVRSY